MSRKEIRAQQKVLKKQRKQSFLDKKYHHEEKPKPDTTATKATATKSKRRKRRRSDSAGTGTTPSGTNAEDLSVSNEYRNYEKQVKRQKVQSNKELIAEEEKTIARMAKKLGLNKRKSKKLPKAFSDMGLDYLLEVCDPENLKDLTEQDLEADVIPKREEVKAHKTTENEDASDDEEEELEMEEDGEETDDDEEHSDDGTEEEGEVQGLVPSGHQAAPKDSYDEELQGKLQKSLKGVINRLSEATLHVSLAQIEEIYRSNVKHEVRHAVIKVLLDSCCRLQKMPIKMMMEHAVFILLLYANVSNELGTYLIENIVDRLDTWKATADPDVDDRKRENMMTLLALLHNFKMIGPQLLLDVMEDFAKHFSEENMACVLELLLNAGFTLRKTDPAGLKACFAAIHAAHSGPQSGEMSGRLSFLMDTITAIKNNNKLKIASLDLDVQEHFAKILRSMLKGNLGSPLRLTLADIRSALAGGGRWWLVGSSWTSGPQLASKERAVASDNYNSTLSGFSAELLELARKQRMNNDLRRTIFCVLMSAEDYIDAFEKLLRLQLKGQQEREIAAICMKCCRNEPAFNPYYALLSQRFCQYDRRFKLVYQYATWDVIKQLSTMKKHQIANLAQFTSAMIGKMALDISVLKVLTFETMGKRSIYFAKTCLRSLLSTASHEVLKTIMVKLSTKSNLMEFRDALRRFIEKFAVTEDNRAQCELVRSLLLPDVS